MTPSHSKLTSIVAIAYVLIVAGGMLLHFFNTGDLGTLKYSLMLPATLPAVFVGSLVAFGLWHRFAWAWWLGLAAVGTQLIRFGSWFIGRLSIGDAPMTSWAIAVLLLAFLFLLLTKATRQQCTR
ncbi:hypothetical protein [Azonexus hydrophilus]|uniref:hypothetical protein n=1 Tax=Azonexus hydrophilus TaxID=418702 RepID=UPI00196394C0|nr:hypothetical protein [Azonexus hydrophilus]